MNRFEREGRRLYQMDNAYNMPWSSAPKAVRDHFIEKAADLVEPKTPLDDLVQEQLAKFVKERLSFELADEHCGYGYDSDDQHVWLKVKLDGEVIHESWKVRCKK